MLGKFAFSLPGLFKLDGGYQSKKRMVKQLPTSGSHMGAYPCGHAGAYNPEAPLPKREEGAQDLHNTRAVLRALRVPCLEPPAVEADDTLAAAAHAAVAAQESTRLHPSARKVECGHRLTLMLLRQMPMRCFFADNRCHGFSC
jgi:hypothetical protein